MEIKYTSGRSNAKRNQAKGSVSINKEKYIKGNSKTTKKLGWASKFIPIVIYISAIFLMAKNMEMVNFSGLICFPRRREKTNGKYSIMMGNGGADCLMGKAFIKKSMVNISFYLLGDLFSGTFKNGLKHGLGT